MEFADLGKLVFAIGMALVAVGVMIIVHLIRRRDREQRR